MQATALNNLSSQFSYTDVESWRWNFDWPLPGTSVHLEDALKNKILRDRSLLNANLRDLAS